MNNTIICPKCGHAAIAGSKFCPKCGNTLFVGGDTPQANETGPQIGPGTTYKSSKPQVQQQPVQPPQGQPQNVYPQYIAMQPMKNSIATAGFVLALIGLFLSWVPVLGWIIWILGLIFSIVGLVTSGKKGRTGRGLAIAGLVISLIGFIILIAVVGGLALLAI